MYGVVRRVAQLVAEIQTCLKLFAQRVVLRNQLRRVWTCRVTLRNNFSFFRRFNWKVVSIKMANFINDKEFLSEFIDLYRGLPELWKVKSDSYRNRQLKNKGYEKLVEKLKEVEPNADRDMVRKKINVLRAAYRRELKKVIASYKSGTGSESVYEPSLWYYEELDFLRDHETQVPGTSTMNDPHDEIDNESSVSK